MNKIIFGDCRDIMRQLIAQGVKVQTCITSPPYFGLRDYGHEGQLGLEETPEAFVANLVEVFQLVRELLADDGTIWLNLGDSYAGAGHGKNGKHGYHDGRSNRAKRIGGAGRAGFKCKQLIGIPWRVALAMQDDGWFLRQDIIWHKPNPMPESVTDRCTKSHEYLFLLSKSPRYFFDSEAIKEPAAESSLNRLAQDVEAQKGSDRVPGKTNGAMKAVGNEMRNRRSVWTVATNPYKGAHFATFPKALVKPCVMAGSRPGEIVFDPFMGSGTTAEVAASLGRQYLGCELNAAYEGLQKQRMSKVKPNLFHHGVQA